MSVIVLAPIRAADQNDHAHVEALREMFERPNWREIEDVHFSGLYLLHMARFQIIEHMTPAMGDDERRPDELLNKYLLFVAEIDGQAVHLYDHLYREEQFPLEVGSPENPQAGAFVRSIWDHCVGYPADDHIYLFRRFMQRYEIGNLLYYTGVPNTRNQILVALIHKELTAAWMLKQQDPALNAAAQDILLGTYFTAADTIRNLGPEKLLQLKDFMFDEPEPGIPADPPPDFDDIIQKLEELMS